MPSSSSLQSPCSWFGYGLSLAAVVCLAVQLLPETELCWAEAGLGGQVWDGL